MIFKYKFLLCLVLLLCGGSPTIMAQQLASWSQFRSFHYAQNPAVVDLMDASGGSVLDVDLAYRKQWTTFKDAPSTALLGLQFAIEPSNMSLGAVLINDQFGPTSYTQVQLMYAYQIQLDRSGDQILSLGLAFSGSQFRVDTDKLKVLNPNDNLLADAPQSQMGINAGLGLYYQQPLGSSRFNKKYFIAGLSAEQLIPSDLPFDGLAGLEANLKREIHFQGFGGFRFYYGSGFDYVEPLLMAKMVANAPVNVFFGTKMTFSDQRFWAGAGVSSDFEGHLQLGLGISETVQLGYATAFYLADAIGASAGMTHEIRLGFRLER